MYEFYNSVNKIILLQDAKFNNKELVLISTNSYAIKAFSLHYDDRIKRDFDYIKKSFNCTVYRERINLAIIANYIDIQTLGEVD